MADEPDDTRVLYEECQNQRPGATSCGSIANLIEENLHLSRELAELQAKGKYNEDGHDALKKSLAEANRQIQILVTQLEEKADENSYIPSDFKYLSQDRATALWQNHPKSEKLIIACPIDQATQTIHGSRKYPLEAVQEIRFLREDIDRLSHQLEDITAEYEIVSSRNSTLKTQLDESIGKLARVSAELNTLEIQRNIDKDQLEAHNLLILNLQNHIQAIRDEVEFEKNKNQETSLLKVESLGNDGETSSHRHMALIQEKLKEIQLMEKQLIEQKITIDEKEFTIKNLKQTLEVLQEENKRLFNESFEHQLEDTSIVKSHEYEKKLKELHEAVRLLNLEKQKLQNELNLSHIQLEENLLVESYENSGKELADQFSIQSTEFKLRQGELEQQQRNASTKIQEQSHQLEDLRIALASEIENKEKLLNQIQTREEKISVLNNQLTTSNALLEEKNKMMKSDNFKILQNLQETTVLKQCLEDLQDKYKSKCSSYSGVMKEFKELSRRNLELLSQIESAEQMLQKKTVELSNLSQEHGALKKNYKRITMILSKREDDIQILQSELNFCQNKLKQHIDGPLYNEGLKAVRTRELEDTLLKLEDQIKKAKGELDALSRERQSAADGLCMISGQDDHVNVRDILANFEREKQQLGLSIEKEISQNATLLLEKTELSRKYQALENCNAKLLKQLIAFKSKPQETEANPSDVDLKPEENICRPIKMLSPTRVLAEFDMQDDQPRSRASVSENTGENQYSMQTREECHGQWLNSDVESTKSFNMKGKNQSDHPRGYTASQDSGQHCVSELITNDQFKTKKANAIPEKSADATVSDTFHNTNNYNSNEAESSVTSTASDKEGINLKLSDGFLGTMSSIEDFKEYSQLTSDSETFPLNGPVFDSSQGYADRSSIFDIQTKKTALKVEPDKTKAVSCNNNENEFQVSQATLEKSLSQNMINDLRSSSPTSLITRNDLSASREKMSCKGTKLSTSETGVPHISQSNKYRPSVISDIQLFSRVRDDSLSSKSNSKDSGSSPMSSSVFLDSTLSDTKPSPMIDSSQCPLETDILSLFYTQEITSSRVSMHDDICSAGNSKDLYDGQKTPKRKSSMSLQNMRPTKVTSSMRISSVADRKFSESSQEQQCGKNFTSKPYHETLNSRQLFPSSTGLPVDFQRKKNFIYERTCLSIEDKSSKAYNRVSSARSQPLPRQSVMNAETFSSKQRKFLTKKFIAQVPRQTYDKLIGHSGSYINSFKSSYDDSIYSHVVSPYKKVSRSTLDQDQLSLASSNLRSVSCKFAHSKSMLSSDPPRLQHSDSLACSSPTRKKPMQQKSGKSSSRPSYLSDTIVSQKRNLSRNLNAAAKEQETHSDVQRPMWYNLSMNTPCLLKEKDFPGLSKIYPDASPVFSNHDTTHHEIINQNDLTSAKSWKNSTPTIAYPMSSIKNRLEYDQFPNEMSTEQEKITNENVYINQNDMYASKNHEKLSPYRPNDVSKLRGQKGFFF